MAKSTFIPQSDHDFLIWMEHFIANLTPDLGTAADLAALKTAFEVFSSKIKTIGDGPRFSSPYPVFQ